jgi:NADH dehydrogenase
MREYVRQKLENSGIEILLGQELKKIKDGDAFMSSGRKIDRAMCVWAAGVRTPGFLETLGMESFKTRLNVNEYLNLTGVPYDKYLFVSGDAAAFYYERKGNPLRMAVMFAVGQGAKAAENILLGIKGKPGSMYRAVDLGYVIPMTTGLAPGIVLGRTVNPKIGYLLHYFMCFYRAPFKGKIKLVRDLILKRRKK